MGPAPPPCTWDPRRPPALCLVPAHLGMLGFGGMDQTSLLLADAPRSPLKRVRDTCGRPSCTGGTRVGLRGQGRSTSQLCVAGRNSHPHWSGHILGACAGRGLKSRGHTRPATGTLRELERGHIGLECPLKGPHGGKDVWVSRWPPTGHFPGGQLAPRVAPNQSVLASALVSIPVI